MWALVTKIGSTQRLMTEIIARHLISSVTYPDGAVGPPNKMPSTLCYGAAATACLIDYCDVP